MRNEKLKKHFISYAYHSHHTRTLT
jgi:hypothetical protein